MEIYVANNVITGLIKAIRYTRNNDTRYDPKQLIDLLTPLYDPKLTVSSPYTAEKFSDLLEVLSKEPKPKPDEIIRTLVRARAGLLGNLYESLWTISNTFSYENKNLREKEKTREEILNEQKKLMEKNKISPKKLDYIILEAKKRHREKKKRQLYKYIDTKFPIVVEFLGTDKIYDMIRFTKHVFKPNKHFE